MRVAHILRKYDATEWGGTETALATLMDGLRAHDSSSVVFAPNLTAQKVDAESRDPYREAGHEVRRFKAFVPALGLSPETRDRLIGLGGNLMSFQLFRQLYKDKSLDLMHSHVLNRLGGVVKLAARARKLPFVVSIHGGKLDLPTEVLEQLTAPLEGGVEYGKIFGLLLGARRILQDADAVVTCNENEANLLREKHPGQRVLVQPHGVDFARYQEDCREIALDTFPQLRGKDYVIMLGRIDEVKNHVWVIEHAQELLRRFPDLHFVFAGPTTSLEYGKSVAKAIADHGFEDRIHPTGGMDSDDPRLLGLIQQAKLLLNASLSETFGLVFLEAWAAGTAVCASATSGAQSMIRDGENGWLFDHGDAAKLQEVITLALTKPELVHSSTEAGKKLVKAEYDNEALGFRLLQLYQELLKKKVSL